MDIPSLGDLPFATVTATMVYQLLGPTTKYLGGQLSQYTHQCVENLERVFVEAYKRSAPYQETNGEVPSRVLRVILTEGPYTDDAVAAAYLGGVLASSKSDTSRDDRGVYFGSLISRLSVYHLRLHFALYSAMHHLFQGLNASIDARDDPRLRLHFGVMGLMVALGFHDDLSYDSAFELDGAISHSLYGLAKEELIGDWAFDWKNGLSCHPSPLGAELFLWANGCGRKGMQHFISKEFVPVETDEVVILYGRNAKLILDTGETKTIDGFDAAFTSHRDFVCDVRSLYPRSVT